MKKRIISVLLLCMVGVMAGCSNQNKEDVTEAETANTAQTSQETEEDEVAADGSKQGASDDTVASKSLVVYFSNTGNTRTIAEFIANGTGADIYEIVAVEPYTEADLNYNDNSSRSTLEMRDESVRPEIAGAVDNIAQYDRIYLGYPIWWGEAPRIVSTFVESYDFTDKTVVPFCTSASSGMGSSAELLETQAGTGIWLAGERFSGDETESDIMDWVNSL